MLPLFLEGPVHALKVQPDVASARDLYARLRESDLYDRKLGMYKVNAPLADQSHEIGRARAFTPGWLENESIWLHMEYKYLLEVLKAGLYEEFYEDFRRALVCFLDPAVYGRSPLENSSFLVSSAHPDESLHGAGFVARLSGATAEFLSIWTTMMAGRQPFFLQNGKLCLAFQANAARLAVRRRGPGHLYLPGPHPGHDPQSRPGGHLAEGWEQWSNSCPVIVAPPGPGTDRVCRRHRPCALRRDGAGRAGGGHRAFLDVR